MDWNIYKINVPVLWDARDPSKCFSGLCSHTRTRVPRGFFDNKNQMCVLVRPVILEEIKEFTIRKKWLQSVQAGNQLAGHNREHFY